MINQQAAEFLSSIATNDESTVATSILDVLTTEKVMTDTEKWDVILFGYDVYTIYLKMIQHKCIIEDCPNPIAMTNSMVETRNEIFLLSNLSDKDIETLVVNSAKEMAESLKREKFKTVEEFEEYEKRVRDNNCVKESILGFMQIKELKNKYNTSIPSLFGKIHEITSTLAVSLFKDMLSAFGRATATAKHTNI